MSGEKNWLFRIQDMIDAIEDLQSHLNVMSKELFFDDAFTQKAVERYFEIIGEAARFVPKDIQDTYKDILWAEIIGMRHKISHDYLKVNPQILWNSYKNDIGPLKEKLQILLEKEET